MCCNAEIWTPHSEYSNMQYKSQKHSNETILLLNFVYSFNRNNFAKLSLSYGSPLVPKQDIYYNG